MNTIHRTLGWAIKVDQSNPRIAQWFDDQVTNPRILSYIGYKDGYLHFPAPLAGDLHHSRHLQPGYYVITYEQFLEKIELPSPDNKETLKLTTALLKPPLGVLPQFIHKEQRKKDIEDAIVRYILHEWHPPVQWVDELRELNQWLENNNPNEHSNE